MRPLLFLLSLALPVATAQAAQPYFPKFARVQQDAQLRPCAAPDYPKASRRNEETGSTTLRYALSPTGTVIDVTVVKSSGFRDLDKAAINGLNKCKFTPANVAGKPVRASMLVKYRWDLE
jgi:protein TonB